MVLIVYDVPSVLQSMCFILTMTWALSASFSSGRNRILEKTGDFYQVLGPLTKSFPLFPNWKTIFHLQKKTNKINKILFSTSGFRWQLHFAQEYWAISNDFFFFFGPEHWRWTTSYYNKTGHCSRQSISSASGVFLYLDMLIQHDWWLGS